MYKSTLEIREDDKLVGDYEAIEHRLVEVKGDVTWRIVTVYRPPPSSKNGLTNLQFREDMEAMLTELLMLPGRLLIVGDFNLHFNDPNDKHCWRRQAWHSTSPSPLTEMDASWILSFCANVMHRCGMWSAAQVCVWSPCRHLPAADGHTCAGYQDNALPKDEKYRSLQLRTGPQGEARSLWCRLWSGSGCPTTTIPSSLSWRNTPQWRCTPSGATVPSHGTVTSFMRSVSWGNGVDASGSRPALRSTKSCMPDNRRGCADHQQCKAGLSPNCVASTTPSDTYRIINGLMTNTTTRSLPSHDSEQELADRFVQFFHCKVTVATIRTALGDIQQQLPSLMEEPLPVAVPTPDSFSSVHDVRWSAQAGPGFCSCGRILVKH